MLKISAIVAAAVLTVAIASPAEAARKNARKRHYVYGQTYQERIAMAGPRARIVVRKRSFLDAGTEVLPGERKFNDYAQPVGALSRNPVDPYRGGDIQWNTSSQPPGFRPGF